MIGGTKFIGPHVARQFVNQGHEVLLYHRGQTEADLPKSIRHIRSPLAAMPVLRFPHELLTESFDAIVHMIPMGEADSRAAMEAFRGRTSRVVALSSGDVYRAYGRLTGTESGPIEAGLLYEDSPLRSVLYPYRKQAKSAADWVYDYEKILVEREILGGRDLPGVILRLPKVYGPGNNADLATVYSFHHQPQWRWTHGYVENVAAAIVLAAGHPAASGRIYNVVKLQLRWWVNASLPCRLRSSRRTNVQNSTWHKISLTTRAVFGQNWVTPNTFRMRMVCAEP